MRAVADGALQISGQVIGVMPALFYLLFTHADQPAAWLDALSNHQPPSGLDRWLTREE